MLALLGAAFTGEALLRVTPTSFFNGLVTGLLGFGRRGQWPLQKHRIRVVIALSSCHFGITTTGGAPGVGRSVTATVIDEKMPAALATTVAVTEAATPGGAAGGRDPEVTAR